MPRADQEILTELKKPIDNFVISFFPDRNDFQRLRLRQLAWQAVDVLAKTGDIGNLRGQKDIARLVLDVKQLGATDAFIEESLALAVKIYQQLQMDYPGVLERYRS